MQQIEREIQQNRSIGYPLTLIVGLVIIINSFFVIRRESYLFTITQVVCLLLLFLALFLLRQERKKNLQKLREQALKFQEDEVFLEKIPVAILFIKEDTIKFANGSCLDKLSSSKGRVLGTSIFNFISKEYWEEFFKDGKWISNKEEGHFFAKLTNSKGEVIDVQVNYRQLEFNKEWGYGLVLKDITKMVEGEKKLQQSEQLSVIGELAAGVAHEIRNPLTSLKGFLQLMDNQETKATSYKMIMDSELERINLIVNELLLLAKPKELNSESHHLLTLINTVVTIANTQAILHNIEIVIHFDKEVENVYIDCEENKLKQVFLNLLKNGIEAMEEEGKIHINLYKEEDNVHIKIIDEGVGIPKEMLDNIGKRFYTTKEDGTGLGMMISMNIIREQNGKMNITSEEGVGTEIEVVLPV